MLLHRLYLVQQRTLSGTYFSSVEEQVCFITVTVSTGFTHPQFTENKMTLVD